MSGGRCGRVGSVLIRRFIMVVDLREMPRQILSQKRGRLSYQKSVCFIFDLNYRKWYNLNSTRFKFS